MDNAILTTGKKYIKDIFSPEQFYNIPEYQRPYVWGEEQILALLEDVIRAMDHDNKKEYFLGCMIWNTRRERDRSGVEYTYQDILDGQQRFITLFLLHGVLRDLSTTPSLKENVQKRLVQEADVYSNIPSRNRIEFEIRDDKEFLDEFVIVKDGTVREAELILIAENSKLSGSIRNMASAILIMRKWWQTRLQELENNMKDEVSEFYTYLSTKVLALYLATPDNLDDAYNLFTVLNSRGLQLQVSDILRAQNLRVISDDRSRKEYATRWSEFENAIGAPFRHFDEFLWNLVFIKMKYRSDENKSLTKAFDFMFKREQIKKGPEMFDYVGKYVNHFEAITNGSIYSKESLNLFYNLNFILTSVFGSQYLILLMHYRECFGEQGIIEFMVKVDNLLSISWLLGRRHSQTRIFIILRKMESYLEKIAKEDLSKEDAVNRFLEDECLKYEFYDEAQSSEKPIDLNEFFQVLDAEKWGSFAGTRVNKTRYLLLKLDLLMGSLSNQLQYNKDSSSIEHLMPQNLKNNAWNINQEEHRDWVHRLGNLVLIDKNKNASLSNKSYTEKKNKYHGGAIEARPNTNYIFSTNVSWDIDTIRQNHMRVTNLLRKYYTGNSVRTLLDLKKSLASQPQSTLL